MKDIIKKIEEGIDKGTYSTYVIPVTDTIIRVDVIFGNLDLGRFSYRLTVNDDIDDVIEGINSYIKAKIKLGPFQGGT